MITNIYQISSKAFKGLINFTLGNLITFIIYDRKYLKGKHFSGRYCGMFNENWNWVFSDFKARVFLNINRNIPWPISPKVMIGNYRNIIFDISSLQCFQAHGSYFQAIDGKICIGKDVYIAPNVGLINSNHNIYNPKIRMKGRDIVIGDDCWIGMNSTLLPGVELGEHTTVGAGAVVTKSFKKGYCVIAGNPAKIINTLDKSLSDE